MRLLRPLSLLGFVASAGAFAWSDLHECETRSEVLRVDVPAELSDGVVSFERVVVDPLVALGRPSRNELGRPLLFFFQAFGRAPRDFVRSELFKSWLGHWEHNLDQDIPRIVVIGWGGLSGALDSVSPVALEKLKSSFMRPRRLRGEIENVFSALPFASSRVVLMGGSMGAANSLQLLRVMPDFFDQVVLYALPDLLDYPRDVLADSLLSIDAARWQNPSELINPRELFEFLQRDQRVSPLLRYLFPDQNYWNAFSPLALLRRGQLPESLKRVPIYLTVGEKDALGYFPAATQWAAEMAQAGFRLEWVPIWGASHGGPFNTREILDRVSGRN